METKTHRNLHVGVIILLKMASELPNVDKEGDRMACAARAGDLRRTVLKRDSRVSSTARSRNANAKGSSRHKGAKHSMVSAKEEKSKLYHSLDKENAITKVHKHLKMPLNSNAGLHSGSQPL